MNCGLEKNVSSFKDAVKWLERMGVDVKNGSRFEKYEKSIESIQGIFSSGSEEYASKSLEENIMTLYEINEIVQIFEELEGENIPGLTGSVKEIANGPDFYTLEVRDGNSSRVRNLGFELLVASRLRGLGEIDLSGDEDVSIYRSACNIVVECKRPFSRGSVSRNFVKANKQLKSRLSQRGGLPKKGIVAIDISKCLNPGFEILKVRTGEDIDGYLQGLIHGFVGEHELEWIEKANNGVIAVLVRFSCLARVEDENSVVYCQRYALVPVCPKGGHNFSIVHELSSELQKRG
jgi:hypothetical protein